MRRGGGAEGGALSVSRLPKSSCLRYLHTVPAGHPFILAVKVFTTDFEALRKGEKKAQFPPTDNEARFFSVLNFLPTFFFVFICFDPQFL